MHRALVLDADRTHAEHIGRLLSHRDVLVTWAATLRDAVRQLKCRTAAFNFMVLTIADRSQPWLEILYQLQQATWQAGVDEFPLFLCISRLSLSAEFQLQIERMGARLVIE